MLPRSFRSSKVILARSENFCSSSISFRPGWKAAFISACSRFYLIGKANRWKDPIFLLVAYELGHRPMNIAPSGGDPMPSKP